VRRIFSFISYSSRRFVLISIRICYTKEREREGERERGREEDERGGDIQQDQNKPFSSDFFKCLDEMSMKL